MARLIRAKIGLRVVTIDLGGWDMHTNIGNVTAGRCATSLTELSDALAAFATDLGPSLADVNVVTMSEFGRRARENGNAGADHGHGGVMLLLGGGLVGGKVHGGGRGWPRRPWTTVTWPARTTIVTSSASSSSAASAWATYAPSSPTTPTPESGSPLKRRRRPYRRVTGPVRSGTMTA